MTVRRMHEGQLDSSAELVRRLLREQFPQWAHLPLTAVASDGTDNAIYRLGDDMAVRMPLLCGPAKLAQIEKEHRWLPAFASVLPLAIPIPHAKGEATDEFPCAWTVCAWLAGDNADFDRLANPVQAARQLAACIHALQKIDPTDGPAPGEHNFMRGVPLAKREAFTQASIAKSEGLVDKHAVATAWAVDRDAPVWRKPGVWIHGDLAPGNLLARDGRLSAMIDWGGLGVGDPATDLLPAWNLFTGESRAAFREALAVDDATWARGRGLALSQAVGAISYYRDTNPAVLRWGLRMTQEILTDF